jgi:hypothetical protein
MASAIIAILLAATNLGNPFIPWVLYVPHTSLIGHTLMNRIVHPKFYMMGCLGMSPFLFPFKSSADCDSNVEYPTLLVPRR